MNAKGWMRSRRWAATIGALAALLAISPAGPGATVLTEAGISWTEEGGAVLKLVGDGGFEPRHFVLDQPDRVVLDLIGAAEPVGVDLPADGRFVRAVRCAPRPDRDGRPVVRYVLETTGAPAYRLETAGRELRLIVAPTGSAPQSAVPAAAAPQAEAGSAPPPPPAVQAAPAVAEAQVLVAEAKTPVAQAQPPVGQVPAAPPRAKPQAAVPAPQAQAVAPAPAKPPASLPAVAPAVMSLDVQDADIRTVLRSISDYAGVNIVADANVQGAVTIRAMNLPWPDMLAAVCRALALEALEEGTVVRVATQKTAREEQLARETAARNEEEYLPLFTRIMPVNYAHADELKETLAKMVSPRGIIEVDKRTNSLVVTDIDPKLEQIEGMVELLDTETVQVEITAKIVDVDATQSRQLGISWGLDKLHSAQAGASGGLGVSAADLVDPPGQMRIGVIRSFGELDAQLQALEQSNEAEIISTPRITTVDNRMARILVGKEVPLITLDYAGNAITELKKVGIALEVTPHINVGDRITMDIHPEVSDLSSQSTVTGGVVFTTTEADTRVLVENGQTAVIAGLIRSGETQFERGVPVLKDLPILGHLFKTSDKRSEKRELLIFITPRIVRPGQS